MNNIGGLNNTRSLVRDKLDSLFGKIGPITFTRRISAVFQPCCDSLFSPRLTVTSQTKCKLVLVVIAYLPCSNILKTLLCKIAFYSIK